MVVIDGIVKRLIQLLQVLFAWISKDKEGLGKQDSGEAYSNIKGEISRRKPDEQKLELSKFSSQTATLYRVGFVLMLIVLGLALVLFAFQGSFHREWINPYSEHTSGALAALNPSQWALALFGSVGIPPFAIYVSLIMFFLGWWLMCSGLNRANPLISTFFVAAFTGQLLLLWSGAVEYRVLIPVLTGALLLIVSIGGWFLRKKSPKTAPILSFLILAILAANGGLLYTQTSSHMQLVLGLSTVQVSTIIMLVFYWYVLGRDAIDGTVTLGHWYAFLSLHLMRSRFLTVFTVIVLSFSTIPFFAKSAFYIPFGGIVMLGMLFLLVRWIKIKRPPDLLAVNLFLLTLVLLAIASQSILAYFPEFEQSEQSSFFFLSPIMLFIYSTIWSFYSTGPLFINNGSKSLPSSARMYLHIGWVLLASNCLMFFVAARDDMFMVLSNQISTEAFLFVAVPFFLYLLFNHSTELLVLEQPEFQRRKKEVGQVTKQEVAIPSLPSADDDDELIDDVATAMHEPSAEWLEELRLARELGTLEKAALLDAKEKPVSKTSSDSKPFRIPGLVFVGISLILVVSVQLTRGLSIVTYARVAYHTARGNLALRERNFQNALAAYKDATAVYKENYKVHFLQSVIYEKLGKAEESQKAVETATKLQPTAVDPWLHMGAMLRRGKHYLKALEAYKKALKLDPSDSFIYRNIGLCYSYLGKHEKAEEFLRKALAIMPEKNEFGNTHYASLAFVHMQAKDYKKAHKALKKALTYNPNDYLALSDMGILLQRERKSLQAAPYLRKALRQRPEQVVILNQVIFLEKRLRQLYPARRKEFEGKIFKSLEFSFKRSPQDVRIASLYVETLMEMKRFQGAEALLERMKKHAYPELDLGLIHARLLMRQKKYSDASKLLLTLASKYKKEKNIFYNMAQMNHLMRRYRDAVTYYKKTLEVDSNHFMSLLNLATIMRMAKKFKQSWSYAKRLEKISPDNQRVLFQIALLYQSQRNYAKTAVYYQKIIRKNPVAWDSLRNLAVTYTMLRQYKKAIPYYVRFLKRFPRSSPYIYFNAGNAFYGIRNYQKAIPYLRRAALTKNSRLRSAALYKVALSYQMLKQDELALKTYQSILKTNPKHLDALINVAMIYRFQKKYRLAEKILKNGLKIQPNHPTMMLQLAFVYQYDQKEKKAIRVLKALLKARPKDYKALSSLASLHEKKRRYHKSYPIYKKIYLSYPKSYQALYGMIATASYRLKRYSLAHSQCAHFFKLPKNPRHRRYRSLLYVCAYSARLAGTSTFERAITLYERILRESKSKDAIAAIYLAELYGKKKEVDKRLEMLRLAQKLQVRNPYIARTLIEQLIKMGKSEEGASLCSKLNQSWKTLSVKEQKSYQRRSAGLPITFTNAKKMNRWLSKCSQ